MIVDTKDIKENFIRLDFNTQSNLLTELIEIFIEDIKGEEHKIIFQAENWINLLSKKIKKNDSTNSFNSIYKKRKIITNGNKNNNNKKFQTFGDDLNSLNYFKNRMEHNDEVNLIELVTCEDEILLGSGSLDKTIKIWSPITGEIKFTSEVQSGVLYKLTNIEGNNLIATTFMNETQIKLWDLKEGILFKTFETNHKSKYVVISNLTHYVKKMIVSYSIDNFIKFWDGDSGEFIKQLDNKNKSYTVIKINKTDMKEKLLIASTSYYNINIWNFDDEQIVNTFQIEDHLSLILKNIIVSDNNLLLRGYLKGEILIFDLDNFTLLRTLKGHKGEISSIIFLDNKFILSSSRDGVIKIWNFFDGEYVGEINTNTEKLGVKIMIDISSEGSRRIAVLLNGERTIRLYDVDKREEYSKLDGHVDEITSIIKVPNNYNRNTIVSSSKDKNIRIWDITNDDETFSLNDLKYNVKNIFVIENDDSMKIIIIFQDNLIHVWNYNYVLNQFRLIKNIETKIQNLKFIVINEDKNLVAIANNKILKIINLENSKYFNLEGDQHNLAPLLSIKTLKREILICVYQSGLIKLCDWKDGRCIHTIEDNNLTKSIWRVITVSNPERNLILAESNKPILVFNADEATLIHKIENNASISYLSEIRTQGKSLFLNIDAMKGNVKIWNAEDGTCVGEFKLNDCYINFIQFMKYIDNLNFIVIGRKNGFTQFFNLDTFEEFKSFNTGMATTIHSLDLIKFWQKEILIGKFENCLKLYDAINFNCLGEIVRNNEALSDYYASPNLIENKKQIMILGWKYGVIKVNIISYLKQVNIETGYKNYLCHGPIFNFTK